MKGNGTRLTWWPLLATILYLVNALHLQGNDLVIKKPRATCVALGCFPVRAWHGFLSFVVQCVVIHNTPDTTKRSNMWLFDLIFFPRIFFLKVIFIYDWFSNMHFYFVSSLYIRFMHFRSTWLPLRQLVRLYM